MLSLKKIAKVIVFSAVIAVGGAVAWWFVGLGISEQTAHRLAIEHAQKQGIDLSHFNPPGHDTGPSRLYSYSWTPKDGRGPPLTIVVDSQTVDVVVTELPNWTKSGAKD